MTSRTGPLSDLRVLDLTQALAGPFCTMLLADLGADVIKIEPPGGDMSRTMGPPPPDRNGCDYGGYFASINRNKRSVVLDIKTDSGRDAIFRLVKTADAVVENSKTGVMDRAGIGYERLREINPALVYAAIRGFGDVLRNATAFRVRQRQPVNRRSILINQSFSQHFISRLSALQHPIQVGGKFRQWFKHTGWQASLCF